MTPLHFAADSGHTDFVRVLLSAGADIEARDVGKNGGNTPLHAAALAGRTETANALVDAGASINARRVDEMTPLHLAALEGRTDTAKALIEAGAKLDARDDNGKTPAGRCDTTKPSRHGFRAYQSARRHQLFGPHWKLMMAVSLPTSDRSHPGRRPTSRMTLEAIT